MSRQAPVRRGFPREPVLLDGGPAEGAFQQSAATDEREPTMLRCLAMFLACLLTLAAPAGAKAQTVLDLASGYPASSFHVQNLQALADDVRTRTQGQLDIRVHPAGSLFKAQDIRQAVAEGRLALGEVFGPSLAAVHPVFAIETMPFLATDHDAALRLWRLTKPLAEKRAAEKGWTLLMSVPWPPQGLFASREIRTIDDIKGLAMRENSPSVRRLAEQLGAKPLTVEAAELGAALRDGRLNLVFTSAAQGVDTRMWETLPWFYTANAWLPRNVLLANPRMLEQLRPEHRKALQQAVAEAEINGWRLSRENAVQMVGQLRAKGMKVGSLDGSTRSRMDRLGGEFVADAMRRADPELLGVMSAFLASSR
jgi:TRAP-type transport system periplasmic protein